MNKFANDIRKSRTYATECYNKNRTTGCASLPVQQLPYSVRLNASCPFGTRCIDQVQFDTGLLDSHTHLGINSKEGDRVKFQFSTTCAVVDVNDRIRRSQDNGYNVWTLHLGPDAYGNYTYQYSTMRMVTPITYTVE
jgi:hypothetical protein